MKPEIPDEELRAYCRASIEKGVALTAAFYQLRAERRSASLDRLRRLWLDEGGEVQEKYGIYAPGTEPMRGR